MAKNDKLTTGGFDLDDGFGFDDSGFQEPGFTPDAKDKGRKPVMDAFRGVVTGAGGQIRDRGFLKETVRKSLPDQYGSIIDAADSATGTLGSLYDDAIRTTKPVARGLAQKLDKLVPQEEGFLRRQVNRLKRATGAEDSVNISNQGSAEENGVQALMGIFAQQQEQNIKQQARTNARELIKENVENRRWGSQLDTLGSIDRNLSRLTQYNQGINMAYQKKSLELQYRSYFAMRELVNDSRRYFEISVKQNEGLLKNTALPEFAKIKNSERFQEIARTNMMSSLQKGFFGGDNIMERVGGRLKDRAKGFFNGIRDGGEMIDGILDQAVMMKEMNREMEEAGLPPLTKEEMAGMQAGGALAAKARDMIAERIQKWATSNEKIGNRGYQIATKLRNADGFLASDGFKDKVNEFRFGGKGGAVKNWLGDLAGTAMELLRPDGPNTGITNGRGIGDLDEPAMGFSNRANLALTDVMPGYLSMIHSELVSARTGQNAAPLIFDFTRKKFVSRSAMGAQFSKIVEASIRNSSLDGRANKALSTILGDENIDDGTRQRLKLALTQMSRDPMEYTPENMRKHAAYQKLDSKDRAILDKRLDDALATDKGRYDVTDSMVSLRQSTPAINGFLKSMIDAGYGSVLEETGIVVQKSDGGYEINTDEYMRLIDKHGIIRSDRNVKKNIKKFSPKSALNRLKKIPIFNWQYKDGKKEGGGTKTGPMAQDVRRAAGDDVAPNGTAIDTVSMNGMTMAAIQELSSRQDRMGKDQNFLRQITINTGRMAKMMEKGGLGFGLDIGKMKSNKVIDWVKKEIKGAPGRLGAVWDWLSGKGDKISKWAGKLYDENKDEAKGLIKSTFSKVWDMGVTGFEMGKNLITEIIPNNLRKAGGFVSAQYNKLKDALEELRDVYVAGRKEPALRAELIKAGYYIDETTQKVIKKLSDIKGNVVNAKGELILSAQEIQNGVFDRYGKPLTSLFGKLKDYLVGGVNRGIDRLRALGGMAMDAFNGWRQKRQAGKDGEGFSIGGFGGSNRILANIQAILETHLGPADPKILKGIMDAVNKGGSVKQLLTNAKASVSDAFASIKETLGKKDGEQSTVEQPSENNAVAPIATGSFLKSAGSLFGKLTGAMGGPGAVAQGGMRGMVGRFGGMFANTGNQPNEPFVGPMPPNMLQRLAQSMRQQQQNQQDFVGPMPATMLQRAQGALGKAKAAWNDTDGDGERQGGWRGRLDKMVNRNKKDFVKASTDPKYRTGDALSSLMSMASGVLGMFGKEGGGILDKATGALEAASDAFGIDFGGKGGKGKATGKGLLGRLKAGMGGLLDKAKGLGGAKASGGLMSRTVKGVGMLASGGVGLLKGALSVGGTALRVGAGVAMSAIPAIASAAATAIGTTASVAAGVLTSPVVLGAAAAAAAGYGAYKAYQYFTQDNLDKFQEIRIKQYGLTNTDKDKHHNHEVLNLEAYLLDGRIAYEGNQVKFLKQKVMDADIRGIFGIDEGDTEGFNALVNWMEYRFRPFFQTHLLALLNVNPKMRLKNIPSMTDEEKNKYLSMVGFESGPYSYNLSPFKDLKELSADKTPALYAIELAKASIKQDREKKENRSLGKAGEDLRDMKAQTANQVVANAKDGQIKNEEPSAFAKAAKTVLGFVTMGATDSWFDSSGDTKKPTSGDTGVSSENVNVGRVPYAGGPLATGQAGLSYIINQTGRNLYGIHPEFLKLVLGMAEEYGTKTGKKIKITDAFRSYEDQARLKREKPGLAASPGKSPHEFGLAIDADPKALNECEKMGLMRKYGLTRPIGGEDWHVEPAGIQVDIERAKKDGNWCSQVIPMGRGKGGGGYGTIPGSAVKRRNPQLALKLLNLGDAPNIKFDEPDTKIKAAPEEHFQAPERHKSSKPDRGIVSRDSNKKMEELMRNSSNVGYAASVNAQRAPAPTMQSVSLSGSETGKGAKPLPKSREEVKQRIEQAARKVGGDPKLLVAFAAVESSLDPNVKHKGSSARGPFGFLNDTWHETKMKYGGRYGLTGGETPEDIEASTAMAHEYIRDNKRILGSVKRDINLTDAYLAHFLGPYGAKKLLLAMQRTPDAIAASILPKQAAGHGSVFYSNGRALTVTELYNSVASKLQTRASEFGIRIDVGSSAGSGGTNRPTTTGGLMTADLRTSPISQGTNNRVDNRSRPNGQAVRPAINTSAMTPVEPVMSTPIDRGSRLGGDVGQGLTVTNRILTDHLKVTMEIRDLLKGRFSNNTGGSGQTPQADSMTASAPAARPVESPARMPNPAINLSRRA